MALHSYSDQVQQPAVARNLKLKTVAVKYIGGRKLSLDKSNTLISSVRARSTHQTRGTRNPCKMLLKTVFMWKANQCQVAMCISTWDTYSSMSIASWMRILLSSLMPPGKDGAWDFLFLLSFSKLSSVRLTDVRTSEVISKYLYAQTISSRKRKLLGCLSWFGKVPIDS